MIMNKRSEILFIYDCTFANPNGDPLDANKPRIDEETGCNFVTDVRLKRTVRDFLHDFRNEEIFVREIADDQGKIQDAKMRAEDFLYKDGKKLKVSEVTLPEMKSIIEGNILEQCIDVRMFGATIPIEKSAKEKSSVTLTGPVQFKIGKSLHRVKLQYIKGTGAFASGKDSTQKTFREEYVLPYSLISFYGIINENAAKYSKMTDEDTTKLMDALWNGTKNLISRSKVGQQPRLLLRVVYKEPAFFLGELDKLIHFKYDKNDEEIRDVQDGMLVMQELLAALVKNKDKVDYVEMIVDERVNTDIDLSAKLSEAGISVRNLLD